MKSTKSTKPDALFDALANRNLAPGYRRAGKTARHSLALQSNCWVVVEGEPAASRGVAQGNRWAGKTARHSLALQSNCWVVVEGEPAASRGVALSRFRTGD